MPSLRKKGIEVLAHLCLTLGKTNQTEIQPGESGAFSFPAYADRGELRDRGAP
jgi:hypothetical protein